MYVDLRPHHVRCVQVLVDGVWHDGELHAYRSRADGGWAGWVWWSSSPGLRRIGWYDEHRVRAQEHEDRHTMCARAAGRARRP